MDRIDIGVRKREESWEVRAFWIGPPHRQGHHDRSCKADGRVGLVGESEFSLDLSIWGAFG